jgi:uncharacterized protein YjbI with pentapeptide repeats
MRKRATGHLDVLAQGVEKWNAWRNRNRDVIPDLGSVDLSSRNLEGVNFSNADLP